MKHWLRPGLLGLHLFALVAVAFCVGMGLWQLGIYDSRQDHERADRQTVPRVDLVGLWGADEPFEGRLDHRPVRVEGRFAATSEQVWVTDRELVGRSGVWLVAPVRVRGSDASLLVVRGGAREAGELPPVPEGDLTFDAVLMPGESSGEPFDSEARSIGSLSVPALTNVVTGDLFSGYAIGTSDSVTGGLTQVEPPDPDVSWTVGLRNLAYALQWWVFAGFALFMWWRMSTENVAARRGEADADEGFDAPVA